jgi:hypothetical protein
MAYTILEKERELSRLEIETDERTSPGYFVVSYIGVCKMATHKRFSATRN